MTTVTGAGAAQQTAAAAAQRNTVDYQSFLKLLVAQAQNQDPTNPTDSTQYLSQLASFSSVEQGVQMNQKLETLLASSRLAEANGLIGRQVISGDGATSGVVAFVTLSGADVVATLESGESLVVGDGVSIGPA
jgi:flagellar basal-body rod modification protein FlgD